MEYRQNSPESPSIQPKNQELNPVQGGGELPLVANTYEQAQQAQHERMNARQVETLQQAGTAQPTVLPQPVASDTTSDSVQSAMPASDATLPLVAADVDLIEKEWVDKAKTVIAQTRDDPYRREQEVKKLQIEYVRKRYGRVIGDGDSLDGDK